MNRLSWLNNPWAPVLGLIAGGALGAWLPAAGSALAPAGQMYLALMQMCVLPIILSAVTASIARLMRGDSAAALPRLALLFLCGLAITAIASLVAGLVLRPGSGLDLDQRIFLAHEMLKREGGGGDDGGPSLWGLVQMIIPTNVIHAAAEGHMLALLLFSVLLGLGLGTLSDGQGDRAADLMDAFYNALIRVMGWILLALPFGLFALMAGHTAQSGLGTFLKLGRLIGTIYGMAALMIAVMVALIAIRTRIAPLTVLGRLRAPLFTAFGSGSSVATLPSALKVCESGLGLRQQTAQMVLPLGVTLYPVGNVLHVVVASLFVLQLYDLPLSLQAGLVVAVGGILVACAMSSAPGVASMTLLAMLLSPFGVPVEVAVVLLVALDPILDPILTTVNVLGNITAASMMEPKRSATSL